MESRLIAEDLRTRARAVIKLGQDLLHQAALIGGTPERDYVDPDRDPDTLALAKAELADRKCRALYFRGDLFGEPGWHILLDLFIQQKVGQRLSVIAACIGSGAPTSTALRYLGLLIEDGLIQREGDPRDGRRSWLKLTPPAVEAMTEYLTAGKGASSSVTAGRRGDSKI